MYCGYITTIKEIHKHSNADRLQCATIYGSNVIVDLSYYIGQRVIYFPVDGQLSEEFANDNNLVRKKDENGNNIGGYLNPDKRNITALKLRGEKSDGLVLPIEVLSKYADISKLKDGDEITVLNGHNICQKYIPQRNQCKQRTKEYPKAKNKKEEKEIVSYPYFAEHKDTAQLAYNEEAFHKGDTIYITRKLHGCFTRTTKVRMADGKLKLIGDIKVGDKVLAYNFNTKQFESADVLQKFTNAKSDNWNKIKISRYGLYGDRRGYITATYNHPFWSEEEKRWIQAKDLEVGMKISVVMPSLILTKIQKEVLIGNLLGDGSLSFHNRSAIMEISQKNSRKEYLDYLIDITNELYYKNNTTYISGYGTKINRIKTHASTDMYNYFNKIINKSDNALKLQYKIVDEFTELSMAIFYMEDGSLVHNDFQNDRANFAICDYQKQDAETIADCFRKFGLNPIIYQDNKNYYRMRLNTSDAFVMFDMIEKYIPPIMRYKLPEKYRNNQNKITIKSTKSPNSYVFGEQIVLENVNLRKQQREYDMETSLHNYIVGNSVVHNTSQRTANTLEVSTRKYPKWVKRIFHKTNETVKKYNIISGTRRVILRNYDGGFYGSNAFRQKYHNYFANKLPKGMSIYYEVVGWVTENTPIMPRCKNSLVKDKEFTKQYGKETVFTYGCEPGENDCYVYRITMTNEDGVVTEIPTEETQIWCERLGVKYVPLLEKFLYTTWEDLNERCEKYLDIPEPLANGSHITEGVVVRIDNRSTFSAYKTKSFGFKVLEGIIKDTSDAPDIEEAQEILET